MAFLDAILVSGKGPRGAAAADTQAYVGTVLGHVGSCWTLITGEHLAGDAVNVVVFANETWCLLLWLSPGGTEESKLKEKKRGKGGTKAKKMLHRKRRRKDGIIPTRPSSFPLKV